MPSLSYGFELFLLKDSNVVLEGNKILLGHSHMTFDTSLFQHDHYNVKCCVARILKITGYKIIAFQNIWFLFVQSNVHLYLPISVHGIFCDGFLYGKQFTITNSIKK